MREHSPCNLVSLVTLSELSYYLDLINSDALIIVVNTYKTIVPDP
jgi:hypothetical protein